MRNKLIYDAIILCSLLFTACSEESLPQDNPTSPDNEGIEIALSLIPQAIQAPAPKTKSNTNVLASSHSGAMDIKLLAEQPDATTRTLDEKERKINNIWVFQFDGNGNDALLVKKAYKTDLTNNASIRVMPSSNQRLVVIANSYDQTLGNTLSENTSKYSDLQVLNNTRPLLNYELTPMSGTDVFDFSTPPEKITINMKHTVAKVTLNIKLGDSNLPTTNWAMRVCNVAPHYWLLEDGTTNTTFPTDATTIVDNLDRQYGLSIDGGSTTATSFTWYLPVNRRGKVDGTTNLQRRTNAPTGATYIRISSSNFTESSNQKRMDYYIHLGANLTDDYNVCGNTHYIYNMTLYTGSDLRVDKTDLSGLQYAGIFGGGLKDVGGGVWQYTKELWVQTSDEATGVAGSKEANTSSTDGKSNTLVKKDVNRFKICFEKNTNYSSINSIDDPNYQWYLPSHWEQVGIWIVHESFNASFKLSGQYWSSSSAWWANFTEGTANDEAGNSNKIRCTKEL